MITPVLFLVFNRPETTARVFEAIRQVRPPRLYVAADGPRMDQEGEEERCAEVRRIATNVDWSCKVKTLFRNSNLGCRRAPSSAIDWFFEHEPEGIILEDDCLPHQDFFYFCEWGLSTFRYEKNVWHINGNNFDCPRGYFIGSSIAFSALPQVWGWATWRDRWVNYIENPFYLEEATEKKLVQWKLHYIAKLNQYSRIKKLKSGLDAWDYQWQITVLNASGLCLVCRSNLVKNIGDGPEATHTKKDTRIGLPVQDISYQLVYQNPKLNYFVTSFYSLNMGLYSIRNCLIDVATKLLNLFEVKLKSFFYQLFLKNVNRIVVASTGRSGSTLLYESLVSGFVESRFGFDSREFFGRIFIKASRNFVSRLDELSKNSGVIFKTHDIFDPTYADKIKFIFVYSEPLEAARSVEMMVKKEGYIWFDKHQYNLRAEGRYDELYNKDVLNFERQILSWLKHKYDSVFILRHDQIWNKKKELEDFVGFRFRLPPQRERASKPSLKKYNIELFDRLTKLMLHMEKFHNNHSKLNSDEYVDC